MGSRLSPSQSRPLQLARQLLRMFAAVVSKAQPEDVHKLRTTIRRLELYVARDGEVRSSKKLAKQLTHIRKLGGKVRDIDIQLDLLASIQQIEVLPARDQLAAILHRRRDKRAGKLVQVVEGALNSGIGKRIARVIAKGPGAAAEVGTSPEAVTLEYLALARSIPEDGDPLHDFRKSVKTLRYRLEALPGSDATALAARLKAVQDALGIWHDWVSLVELAEARLQQDRVPFTSFLRSRVVARRNEARHAAAALRDQLTPMTEVRKPPARALHPSAHRAAR